MSVNDTRREYLAVPGTHRVLLQGHYETDVHGRPAEVINYCCVDGELAGRYYRLLFVQRPSSLPRQSLYDIRAELKEAEQRQEAFIVVERREGYIHTSFFAKRPKDPPYISARGFGVHRVYVADVSVFEGSKKPAIRMDYLCDGERYCMVFPNIDNLPKLAVELSKLGDDRIGYIHVVEHRSGWIRTEFSKDPPKKETPCPS